jgi:hypothetical protein
MTPRHAGFGLIELRRRAAASPRQVVEHRVQALFGRAAASSVLVEADPPIARIATSVSAYAVVARATSGVACRLREQPTPAIPRPRWSVTISHRDRCSRRGPRISSASSPEPAATTVKSGA